MDLAAFNGDPSWTLTMPARYVLASDGMIEYADISVDDTRRGVRTDPGPRPPRRALADFADPALPWRR